MIYESYVYKNELNRIADRLDKRLVQKRWPDHSLFLLERDIFIAFYIIRKLIEAKSKISSRTMNMKVKLVQYMPTGKSPNILNDTNIDELYVMDKPSNVAKGLVFLCNQFIHSYIFCPYFETHPQSLAILFNSFYERTKGPYCLSVADLILIIRKISNDNPSSIRMRYNPEELDYDIWAGDTDEGKL